MLQSWQCADRITVGKSARAVSRFTVESDLPTQLRAGPTLSSQT